MVVKSCDCDAKAAADRQKEWHLERIRCQWHKAHLQEGHEPHNSQQPIAGKGQLVDRILHSITGRAGQGAELLPGMAFRQQVIAYSSRVQADRAIIRGP